jgi:hypothetical protein
VTSPRAVLLLGLAALAGCGAPTSLSLSLSLDPGVPAPDTLVVSLYGAGRLSAPAIVPLSSAGKSLPGTLVLGPLDASAPDFRVQVDGLLGGALVAQAAARQALARSQQNRLALTLGPPLADSDGDGVPDAIDDCPTKSDPDQRCASADLGGDLGLVDATKDASFDLAFPPGPPCPNGAIFCDDFETGDLSHWNGKIGGSLASVTVDATQPYRGKYALDARSTPFGFGDLGLGGAGSAAATEGISPSPATLWVRAYVYHAAAPPPFEMVLALSSGTLGFAAGAGQAGTWAVTQDDRASPDEISPVPIALDHWTCVELGLDETSHLVSLYIDGQKALAFTPARSTLIRKLEAGLVSVPSGPAAQVYLDDVALAASRIGCE